MTEVFKHAIEIIGCVEGHIRTESITSSDPEKDAGDRVMLYAMMNQYMVALRRESGRGLLVKNCKIETVGEGDDRKLVSRLEVEFIGEVNGQTQNS